MTTTIRQTERFQYFEDKLQGVTAIYDNYTGSQTDWNTGSEAQREKDYLKDKDDNKFNEYCELMTSKD